MSSEASGRAGDSPAAFFTKIIGTGLRRIDGDLNRMGAALRRGNPNADYLPIAAFDALDAASGHAGELRKTLAGLPIRHPARSHATAGLDSLVAGLKAMRRLWLSYATPNARVSSSVERDVRRHLAHARAELLAAERVLGCPWGCQEQSPEPKIPPFGSRP